MNNKAKKAIILMIAIIAIAGFRTPALANNYNPLGPGKMGIDTKFANSHKGQILLEVEHKGESWYVNPSDGRRYFLGRPADAFNIMRHLGLGIANKDFASLE